MVQDSDVARVAAAMNAPGFKYRSFGNEPVRIRPGAAGTLAQPPTPTPAFLDDLPLPETSPVESFAAEPFAPEPLAPEPFVPEPFAPGSFAPGPFAAETFSPDPFVAKPFSSEPYDDTPAAPYAYDNFADPLPELPPMMAPPAAPTPPPAPAIVAPEPPPPAPPLFSWPEASPARSTAPMPAVMPVAAPPMMPVAAPKPQAAQAYAPPAAPAALAPGGFRLLESIGHRPGESAPPSATGQPGGTLGLLRRAAEIGGDSNSNLAGMGLGSPYSGPMPPVSPSGHQSGLLPAAAVTVPLSDVMRLIAAGATPPPSPFDAFRAALGAQPGR